jgi:hypothetical protein
MASLLIAAGRTEMPDEDLPKFAHGQKVMVRRYVTSDMYHRATCLGPGHPFRTSDAMLMSSQPIPSLRVRFDDGEVLDVDYSRLQNEDEVAG